jgi:hypothetical protein
LSSSIATKSGSTTSSGTLSTVKMPVASMACQNGAALALPGVNRST